MMSEYGFSDTICVIAAGIVVYRLLRRRLLITTHEYRIRVGNEAVHWSSDSRVTDEVRASLNLMANAMYQPLVPWVIAIALIVAVLPIPSFRRVVISDNAEVARQVLRVKLQLVLALITASPLACIIGLVALVLGFLLRSSASVVMETISAAGDASFQKFHGLGRVSAHH